MTENVEKVDESWNLKEDFRVQDEKNAAVKKRAEVFVEI